MKKPLLLLACILPALIGYAAPPDKSPAARMTREETLTSIKGLVLKGSEKLVTPDSFHPPVEITVVAKTDSTNLRLGYAADQVIFNWEVNQDQLRVDGGPADGQHTSGAGKVPSGKYVTIKWVVTPKHQAIYVDDQLRFEHSGDYSEIDKPVSVFPANGSKVTVKSIAVKQLTTDHVPQFLDGANGIRFKSIPPPPGGYLVD